MNGEDAGRKLAEKLGPIPIGTVVVAASVAGLAVARAIDPEAQLISDNIDENVDQYTGCSVLVIDLGVETGTRAWEIVQRLRAINVAQVSLAVPVCSRQVLAKLQTAFDSVSVLVTPLAPRSLRWHYEVMD